MGNGTDLDKYREKLGILYSKRLEESTRISQKDFLLANLGVDIGPKENRPEEERKSRNDLRLEVYTILSDIRVDSAGVITVTSFLDRFIEYATKSDMSKDEKELLAPQLISALGEDIKKTNGEYPQVVEEHSPETISSIVNCFDAIVNLDFSDMTHPQRNGGNLEALLVPFQGNRAVFGDKIRRFYDESFPESSLFDPLSIDSRYTRNIMLVSMDLENPLDSMIRAFFEYKKKTVGIKEENFTEQAYKEFIEYVISGMPPKAYGKFCMQMFGKLRNQRVIVSGIQKPIIDYFLASSNEEQSKLIASFREAANENPNPAVSNSLALMYFLKGKYAASVRTFGGYFTAMNLVKTSHENRKKIFDSGMMKKIGKGQLDKDSIVLPIDELSIVFPRSDPFVQYNSAIATINAIVQMMEQGEGDIELLKHYERSAKDHLGAFALDSRRYRLFSQAADRLNKAFSEAAKQGNFGKIKTLAEQGMFTYIK